jgi:hypothetical protein
MSARGVIEEQVAEPLRRLVEQPLPDVAPKREVQDRVDDAVAHFGRRGATAGDRRAAVVEMAAVLEYLRDQIKEHMLQKDEGDLFRLANEFALRHNKPTTRRDCLRSQRVNRAISPRQDRVGLRSPTRR